MNLLSFLKQCFSAVCLWLCGVSLLYAANVSITTLVDDADPKNDDKISVDLSRLLPIAEGNSWTYDLTKGGSSPTTQSIEAEVGFKEKIGGGCLAVNPVVLGGDLTLYLANYGDYLSLYGIHINRWKGLDDLVMKFETRDRVYWKDFENRYISGKAKANSCQDTEWGRVERTGLVLLENLNENLGTIGNKLGQIDCKTKNSDLRSASVSSPVQTGSGTATVRGKAQTLYWSLDSIAISSDHLLIAGTPGYVAADGDLGIEMVFNPDIHSSGNDYRMFINMVLRPRVGIVSLQVNDDIAYTDDAIHDLSYTLTDSDLESTENQIVPKGTCPGDSGSFSFLILSLLMACFPFRMLVCRFKI